MITQLKKPSVGDKIFIKEFGWLKIKARIIFNRGNNLKSSKYSIFKDKKGKTITYKNTDGNFVILKFYDEFLSSSIIKYIKPSIIKENNPY